ncbi:MAG: hypothetical protein ACOX5Y_02370 [Acholeplasmataceae bacterium]
MRYEIYVGKPYEKDVNPKILLANTTHPMIIKDGVKVFDLARWLIGDEN